VLSELSKSDARLLGLLETAREYAEIYLLAKKRQKGCDGMGELTMVREEFSTSFDRVIHYCAGKGYLSGDIQYKIDSMAAELTGMVIEISD
jgi:hypothetical protein